MTDRGTPRRHRSPHALPTVTEASPSRVAVIGAGGIAKEHLAFLAASPLAELVAVSDVSRATADFAARRWSAGAAHTSHRAMLQEFSPDITHVLTPPHTHEHIVADVLASGSHVICEKPLATDAAALRRLLDLADGRGLWLLEDQNYRWNDPVLELRQLVLEGRLGVVRDVEVRMALGLRDGGVFADPHLRSPAHDLPAGPIHDLLPHLAYLGLMFVPAAVRPERVSAHWSNHGGEDGLWRWDDLDATLVAQGAHLRLRYSAATRPEALSITVRGELGEASTDIFQPHLLSRSPRRVGKELTPVLDHVVNGVSLARSGARNLRQKLLQHNAYHGLHRFLQASYEAMLRGNAPPLSRRDMEDPAYLIDLLLAPENRR